MDQSRRNTDLEGLFERLGRSGFRSKFRLQGKELEYLRERGLEAIRQHARQFVRERLAPAKPANDGRQTPMKGHPVFVAQHATGTCCRGCLAKWHGIQKGSELDDGQIDYIVSRIMEWISRQTGELDIDCPPGLFCD